jgi:hypothetical protein
MDPITTAVLAALPLLATDAVKSSYEGLKAVVSRKWGENGAITKAIKAVEEDPKSKAQAAVLQEKVAAAEATKDIDVAQALHTLIEELKARNAGGEAVSRIHFTMTGGTVQGIAGAENVNIGSMTFGATPKN